jgi:hypothetical protein
MIQFFTVKDLCSFCNMDTGTWSIQCLWKELNSADSLPQIVIRTTWLVMQLEYNSNMKQFHRLLLHCWHKTFTSILKADSL